MMALAGEARRVIRRMAITAAIYLVVGVLALAALAFLYVLIYRLLSEQLGGDGAAAILVGGNLLLIGLILGVRALLSRGGSGRRGTRASLPAGMTAGVKDLGQSGFEAGMALGSRLGAKVRRAAPEIALTAGIIGLIVGLRPGVLSLFRRHTPPRGDKD